MTTGRVRLTRRGWIAIAATLVLVVAGLGVLRIALKGPSGCTLEVGDRTVDLDPGAVETAATSVAAVVRAEGSAADATRTVARATSLSTGEARDLAAALTGRERAALSCTHGGASTDESDDLTSSGLTDRADVVREDLREHFGAVPLGGFEPGGVTSGHMPGSAHYEGRAIDVFFRPISAASKTHGWAVAHYLVAHADRLEIDTVIFDGRIWTARRAPQGWRDYDVDTAGKARPVAQVLEHRDHVHVDVAD